MNQEAISPLDLLERIAGQSRGNQLGDSEDQGVEVWRGFTFQVADTNIAVPFDGHFEIVPLQPITPVPMAESWALGMINIRGEIYTVIDFAAFLGEAATRLNRQCNLFLLPDPVLKSALLISGRIGLNSFAVDLPMGSKYSFIEPLRPFLSSVISIADTLWGVLDITKLMSAPRFVSIGRAD